MSLELVACGRWLLAKANFLCRQTLYVCRTLISSLGCKHINTLIVRASTSSCASLAQVVYAKSILAEQFLGCTPLVSSPCNDSSSMFLTPLTIDIPRGCSRAHEGCTASSLADSIAQTCTWLDPNDVPVNAALAFAAFAQMDAKTYKSWPRDGLQDDIGEAWESL